MTSAAFDARDFRACLGQFPTGVCVVTADVDGELIGMTISSFNSLSLEPPLVLFSIDHRALGLHLWQKAESFAINVLSAGQEDISNRFAKSGGDKWTDLAFSRSGNGAPQLEGAAAVFECSPFTRQDAGDHELVIAKVDRFTTSTDKTPLVFCKGRYAKLDAAG